MRGSNPLENPIAMSNAMKCADKLNLNGQAGDE
jgi:hypothetical protein